MTAGLVFIAIPLLVVWVLASYDVLRDQDLGRYARGVWIVAFTLAWPTILLWLLIRQPGSRLDSAGRRAGRRAGDPRSVLVTSALAHERGLIDDRRMAEIKRQLR